MAAPEFMFSQFETDVRMHANPAGLVGMCNMVNGEIKRAAMYNDELKAPYPTSRRRSKPNIKLSWDQGRFLIGTQPFTVMLEERERVGDITTAHTWCKEKVPRDSKVPHSSRRQLSTPADEALERGTRKRRHRIGIILYRSEVGGYVTTSKQVTAHVGVPADFCIGLDQLI